MQGGPWEPEDQPCTGGGKALLLSFSGPTGNPNLGSPQSHSLFSLPGSSSPYPDLEGDWRGGVGSLWVHGGVNAAVGSEEMVIKLAFQEQRTWVDGVLLLHVICIDIQEAKDTGRRIEGIFQNT